MRKEDVQSGERGQAAKKLDDELLAACASKAPGRVQRALDKGADPNATDEERWTPLMICAYFGHEASMKMLLERGADVERRQQHGLTAKKIAEGRGNAEALRTLEAHEEARQKAKEVAKEAALAAQQASKAWRKGPDSAMPGKKGRSGPGR